MDALALSNELNNLEKSWVSLDGWLNLWTLLVVVGVTVELFVILTEYWQELGDFWAGVIVPPRKPSTLLLVFGLLGAGLVAIGVAGEFWVHIKAGKIESDMRITTGKLVALVNERAANANSMAQGAELQSSLLQANAEQLRKEAEDEKMARVQLEKLVAWRTITKEQQEAIAERLKQISGVRIDFDINAGDSEGFAFGTQIAAIALKAQWRIIPFAPSLDLGHLRTGVRIGSTADDLSRNAANALTKELNNLKFDAIRLPVADTRTSDLHKNPLVFVFVGLRPQAIPNEISKAIAAQK